MPGRIVPYIARVILSPQHLQAKRARAERKRKRHKAPHLVTVYLRINDPYSYLLLQVLEHFEQRFPVKYDFRTVLNLQPDMYPAPALWEKNAFQDGLYLAELYRADFAQLSFPEQRPPSSPQLDAGITAQLLHWELQPGYLQHAMALFHAYWQADQPAIDSLLNSTIADHAECYQHHLGANEQLLKQQGHYLSGMLHYSGEWYWGLDRLQYLERRLNSMGLARGGSDEVIFNRPQKMFCSRMSLAQINKAWLVSGRSLAEREPITLFFSMRSPYSYIGLLRVRQLAQHYQVPLVIKPVLPMVMRRMQVPGTKGSYITQDVKREATLYGINFGLIADPLGKGVENCYALYEFAQSAGKGIEFLESYARGVWAEGIHSDTKNGLQKLVSRIGLDWQQARKLLADESWRLWAQENLTELYSHDLWGVPSFRFADTCVFGQDRLDCIECAIEGHLR